MKFSISLHSCIALLILQAHVSLFAAPAKDDPIFQLSFDNDNADAVVRGQKNQAPLEQKNLRFVKGIKGSALYLGKDKSAGNKVSALLKYSADHLFASEAGTVSFWVQPDWDGLAAAGSDKRLDYRFFSAYAQDEADEKNKDQRRIWLWMWNWLRCDLTAADGKTAPNLQWKCRNTWMKGDWWHVAVSWDKEEGRKLYVNGVPVYRTGQVDLDDINYFFIGAESPTQLTEAAFDEFKIYSHRLSHTEIESQFREFAPLDFTLERRFLRAGKKEQISIDVSSRFLQTDKQSLAITLSSDKDQQVLARWDGNITAKSTQNIQIPLPALPVGDYRLQCVMESEQGSWQRSFPITLYQQNKAPEVSSKALELGELLIDIDLTRKENDFRENVPSHVKQLKGHGPYLEAGAKKWDRIAVELPEINAPSSPLVVEIEWPDDKERSMSFYLFVASERKQHRDRLSGGVHSGGEYPLSGSMQKTRYLFYPESKNYLFEVRTLTDGLPAAVSRLKIYTLANRLPKLSVETPENLPTRNIGHLDEDQSFEINMPPHSTSPHRFGYAISIMENLLDHNDYTGQNTLSYPVLRYSWSHLDTYPVNNIGSKMRVTGWIELLMDMMEQRQQNFFPSINLYTIAGDIEMSPAEQQALVKQGQFLYDNTGKAIVYGSPKAIGNNPVHPAVKKRFLSQIDALLHRFGDHAAFKGINLWMHTPVFFTSLKRGYGDYTIALFEKESGLKVPVSSKGPERYAKRHEHLTGPGKKEWLAWREQVNLKMINEISTRLQRTKKGSRLYVSLNRDWQQPRFSKEKSVESFDLKAHCYEHFALDLDAINRIDSVSVTPMTTPTASRSNKHWNHNAPNLNYELMTDVDLYRPFRNDGQGAASLYYVYFESFMDSLSPEKYASYFQNSDPKATGRNFLADFSIAMAAQNPETIFAGAQPLGTTGREDVAREFARNFRALPAGRYEDVPSMTDPVTARFLITPQGTYLYQVNLLPWPVDTEISFSQQIDGIRHLGKTSGLALSHGNLRQILEPFQLRSYFIKGHQVKATAVQVTLEPKNQQWLLDQQHSIAKSVTYLEKWNGEFKLAKQMLQKIEAQYKAGHFANAYRRINSRAIRVIPQLIKEAVKTKPEFTDNFDDPKLSAENWKLPAENNVFKDGMMVLDSKGTSSVALQRNLEGDMIVEAIISPQGETAGGWGGILFRGAKLLLRNDGFWAIYKVNGSDKSKGQLHKEKVVAGKEYHLKIMRRGNMSIFYVNGEKLLVANEKEGLQGNDEGLSLASTKYPVTFKQVKLSRIIEDSETGEKKK